MSRDNRRLKRQYRMRYWRARRRMEERRFWWRRLTFATRIKGSGAWANARLTAAMLRGSVGLVLAATALVAVPELIITRLTIPFPTWLPLDRVDRSFDSFVAGAAALGGTLLGLYFATVGIVDPTVYADAPDSVRRLFLEDRTNRVYVRAVSILVLSSIAILALDMVGYTPHAMTLTALGALALVAVVSLIHAGSAAFNFFNPAALAHPHERASCWTRASSVVG